MHTGEALYACPLCPSTFSHSSNVYKHLHNMHSAEYAAYKQHTTSPNILKIAKTASEEKRSQKPSTDSSFGRCSNENLLLTSHLIASPDESVTIEIERYPSLMD